MNATRPSTHKRPGLVREIKGIHFQSDGQSTFGEWFIRPLERLDRRVVGIHTAPDGPSLAMHVGIHTVLEMGPGRHEEWVAEALHGTRRNYFRSGFNWTPIETFCSRDRGGWDMTIPATAFRTIDERQVRTTVERLNSLEGHPFVREDCTAFLEHMFSHQMFAHLPILGLLGIEVRIGDPALPLLRPDAELTPEQARLLRFEEIRHLADTPWGFEPTLAGWRGMGVLAAGTLGVTTAYLLARARARRAEERRRGWAALRRGVRSIGFAA
jgi:hypothetical protein